MKAKPSDIWALHARGFTNCDIARKLKISEGTVRYHLKQETKRRADVFSKNAELAQKAVEIDLDRQKILNDNLRFLAGLLKDTLPSDTKAVETIIRLINDTIRTSKIIEPGGTESDAMGSVIVPDLIKIFLEMNDVTRDEAIEKIDACLTK